MKLTYLNILKSEIPCEKIFLIEGTEYTFLFSYNDLFDFYTVTVKDMSGEVIFANKFSYMRNAFDPVVAQLPRVRLVPISLAEFERSVPAHERISADNFDDVRICLI